MKDEAKELETSCGGVALYEALSDHEGYYYCSECGRALDDHKT